MLRKHSPLSPQATAPMLVDRAGPSVQSAETLASGPSLVGDAHLRCPILLTSSTLTPSMLTSLPHFYVPSASPPSASILHIMDPQNGLCCRISKVFLCPEKSGPPKQPLARRLACQFTRLSDSGMPFGHDRKGCTATQQLREQDLALPGGLVRWMFQGQVWGTVDGYC